MRLWNDGFDILEVNADQFAVLDAAYRQLGCQSEDMGDGVIMYTFLPEDDMKNQVGDVVARLRRSTTN